MHTRHRPSAPPVAAFFGPCVRPKAAATRALAAGEPLAWGLQRACACWSCLPAAAAHWGQDAPSVDHQRRSPQRDCILAAISHDCNPDHTTAIRLSVNPGQLGAAAGFQFAIRTVHMRRDIHERLRI